MKTKKFDGIFIKTMEVIAVVMAILVALMWGCIGVELYNRYSAATNVVEEPGMVIPGESLLHR